MYRSIAALLLGLQLAGCMTWRRQPQVSPEVLEGEARARLLLRDGSEIDLRDPRMANDSITGFRYAGVVGNWVPVGWAAPADSVVQIKLHRTNTLATIGITTLVFMTVVWLAADAAVKQAFSGR